MELTVKQLIIDLMGDSAFMEKWMFRASKTTNSQELGNALMDMAFQKRFFRVKLGNQLLNYEITSNFIIQVEGLYPLDRDLESAVTRNLGKACLMNRGTALNSHMASNLNVAIETRKVIVCVEPTHRQTDKHLEG